MSAGAALTSPAVRLRLRCASAASFIKAKRGDKLMLLHATEGPSSAAKPPLPKNLQPSSIKRTYEDIASTSRVSTEWVCTEKSSEEQTIGQCIAGL